jgi:hypothetical protein
VSGSSLMLKIYIDEIKEKHCKLPIATTVIVRRQKKT